ncbi:MAG: type II toxin-antitoxin system PemK/MazF family toxin, partial [Bifidobacteriaceae bacterium]|nr:type II toxin-antitoxin system PemK/MazF family toxin [Bifidobacteriaceae bacterium]
MPSSDPAAQPGPAEPRLGEIWLTAFGAGRAGEPTKTRPALILSAHGQHSGSPYDLVVVAPISATMAPTLSRPAIAATAANDLEADSVVVARALRSVSTGKLFKKLGAAEPTAVAAVR